MPDTQVVIELGASAIAALGGGGVITVAVCAYASKLMADITLKKREAALSQQLERLKGELGREAETHKFALKKQELIFNKEVEAASAFMKLHRQITPSFSHPDMDWGEACEQAAGDLFSTERKLENYIIEYGAVISGNARKMLFELKTLASHYKFDGAEPEDNSLRNSAKLKAGELIETLPKIEEELIKAIRQ